MFGGIIRLDGNTIQNFCTGDSVELRIQYFPEGLSENYSKLSSVQEFTGYLGVWPSIQNQSKAIEFHKVKAEGWTCLTGKVH